MCMVSLYGKYSSIICTVCLSVTSPAMVYFDTYYKDIYMSHKPVSVGC